MAWKRRGKKRENELERERDIHLLLSLKLEGLEPAQIYDRLNHIREEIAYRRARALGADETTARMQGKDARITPTQLRIDLKDALTRIKRENDDKSRVLVQKRLGELIVERESLRAMEERCWDLFNETPETKWMERIESVFWKRYQLGFEIFRLQCVLGLEIPEDVARLYKGDMQAAQNLKAHEVGLLYSMEARAGGLDPTTAKARFQMISGYLEAQQSGGEGDKQGPRVIFEIRGLEVEE